MEFNIGDVTIGMPPLHITIAAIIIIYLLVRWSKQLETRRFTVYFYFLISIFIAPIYSHSTQEGVFELWIPMGFLIVFFYMHRNKNYHPSMMKASILGLCVAVYQLLLQYSGA